MDHIIKALRTKGVVFCTDSFKKEEIELLIPVLQTKFNLICTIQKSPSKNSNSRLRTEFILVLNLYLFYEH